MNQRSRLRDSRSACVRRAISKREFLLRMLVSLCTVATPGAWSAAASCEQITGLDRVSHAPGAFVADMHGTVEAPAFVRSLVCNLLRSGRPVVLALEYPSDEQHFINEFLHTIGGKPQVALLSSPFWSRPTQDGRTSRAMLDLLDWVRQQLASGAHVRVVAFDSLPKSPLSGAAAFDARDAEMAVRLREDLARLAPDEFPVIFTGNVHARKTKGLPFLNAPSGAEQAEPLGYRLRDLGLVHINADYRGGSAWTCAATCGVQWLGKPGPGVSSFSIRPSADSAYDLEYFVGSFTASPPAAGKPISSKRGGL
jgi:hypothetical protein